MNSKLFKRLRARVGNLLIGVAWLVTQETIGAVIDAYGAGEIDLEAVDAEHSHQTFRLPDGKRYSLATIARFLGWVKPSDGQAVARLPQVRRSRGPTRHRVGAWAWRAAVKVPRLVR